MLRTHGARWRWPRRNFIRASPKPSPPSPAPAAKRRSRHSRGRFGARWVLARPASARSASSHRRGETYGSLTTPDPVELHRSIDALAGDGVTHLAIEASSHGLDQFRLDGLRIAAGGFTNITRDHLDYHQSFEAYLAAKLRLFEALLDRGAAAVVDVDHDHADAVLHAAKARGLSILSVGRSGTGIRLVEAKIDGFAQVLRLEHGWQKF